MSEATASKHARANDRPILSEARKKSLIALVGAAVSAAVSFSVISPELAEQINAAWAWALGAIVTVIPFVTSILHALGIVKGAEKQTTPVDSPSDHDGEPLVPLHAAGLGTVDDEEDVPEDGDSADGAVANMPEPDSIVADDGSNELDEQPDVIAVEQGHDVIAGRHREQPGSTEQTGRITPVEG